MTDSLEHELIELIIDFCNVEDADAAAIDFNQPLIGPDSAFGLDSLDAVEVVVAVQKTYGVRIGSEQTSREVLRSITTLAEYIRSQRQ